MGRPTIVDTPFLWSVYNKFYGHTLFSRSCITRGISRLAKLKKRSLLNVNEYFKGKRNAEITLLGSFFIIGQP